jgi:hypothetical protein
MEESRRVTGIVCFPLVQQSTQSHNTFSISRYSPAFFPLGNRKSAN